MLGLLLISPLSAQIRVVPAPVQNTRTVESTDGVFLKSDRTLSRGIQKAQQRIAAGEYSQAIRFLDEVLQPEKEDSFLLVGDSGEFAGLKETARKILCDLPAEGKQLVEATYGPVARRELREAIASGDFEAIRRVAHRYFSTSAGLEAALLLAQYEADSGQHLAAALAYQELLESREAVARFEPQLSILAAEAWLAAESKQRAQDIVQQLSDRGIREVELAGRGFRFNLRGQQPLDWLSQVVGAPKVNRKSAEQQWLTTRGNSVRNGQVEGGMPHARVRWAVRLLSHPRLEEIHDNTVADRTRQEKSLAVAAAPLAVGDYIITRSAHNLVAVDFRTGKRVWQVQPQRVAAIERLISVAPALESAEIDPAQVFSERIWKDYLYNGLSSDGEHVFAIRDITLPEHYESEMFRMQRMRGMEPEVALARSNRLCAYELATQGKLVWEIDGATNGEELSGAFFLGAPLAIGQSLYSLVEIKSAIFLVAIERGTGDFQWKQQLVSIEADIFYDLERRYQATIPSYDSGVLVCPTGAGVVVGVDLAKHALAWAYRYETNRIGSRNFRGRRTHDFESKSRWTDSAVILDNGRVVFSPPESTELHCLDLATGKLLWKRNQKERLFLAGVSKGRVLMVNNKDIAAYRLEDGKPAWELEKLDLPSESVPTGRGFFSQGKYYLPTNSAEVLAVDVEAGSFVSRAVARDGQVLGNLVCHRGAVLSQTGRVLDCFDQVDVLRSQSQQRLAQNPEDGQALRTLGEIAYSDGQLSEAIALLRRAYSVGSESIQTRDVLIECLEVALEENFAAFREHLPLLQELQQGTIAGQHKLLRLQAQGLLKSGDPLGAFAACLQLYGRFTEPSEVYQIGRNARVNVARWLRAQVAAVWEQANSSQRQKIIKQLEEVMTEQEVASDPIALHRFVECFQSIEFAEPMVLRLANQNLEDGQLLLAQQQYLSLSRSKQQSVRAETVARCAEMLHANELHRQAKPFDEILRDELSEVVCLDGRTGRECLVEWNALEPVDSLSWPFGEVEINTLGRAKPASRPVRSQLTAIRWERTDEVLGMGNLFFSIHNKEIIVRDSLGIDISKGLLPETDRVQIQEASNSYGVSRGNLLVVSMGRQLIAFDTLSGIESKVAKPLWRISVANASDEHYRYGLSVNRGTSRRPAPSQAPRSMWEDNWIGVIGPVTRDSCVFQDQRRLVCVDSLTGETLWSRSDVPAGCDLFGDEQFVFAVPRASKEAQIFSMVDGRRLGESTVPRWQEQLATIGRQVIRWRTRADGLRELSSVDALTGEVSWKFDYEKNSHVDITRSRFVAVVEPSGRCAVVDAENGRVMVEQKIEANPVLNQVAILAGSESCVVFAQQPKKGPRERRVSGLNPWDYAVMNGQIYAFDLRTGQALWNRPAEVYQEALMFAQPVDSPIIAFAGGVVRRDSGGSKTGISLVLLEKATGRLLLHDDTLPVSGANYCVIRATDTEEHQVAIEMASRTVQLTFTDRPRPPEPPAIVGGEFAAKKGHSGLYGIGRKLLGGE